MSYLRLGLTLGVVLALIGAFFFGRGTGVDSERADNAKRDAKITEAINKGMKAMDYVSGQLAEARNAQAAEVRTIRDQTTRIIERPVYRNECVDADGVSLLDRAAAAANRGIAGAPDDATPAAPGDAPEG